MDPPDHLGERSADGRIPAHNSHQPLVQRLHGDPFSCLSPNVSRDPSVRMPEDAATHHLAREQWQTDHATHDLHAPRIIRVPVIPCRLGTRHGGQPPPSRVQTDYPTVTEQPTVASVAR